MNFTEEIDKIMNDVALNDVDVPDEKEFEKFIADNGQTVDEFRAGLLSEAVDVLSTIAQGAKIVITGKDGFKTHKEFHRFIAEFHMAYHLLDSFGERLKDMMIERLAKSKDGKEFLKELKIEAAEMLLKKLKEEK
jgi:hypothetical protein